MFLFIFFTEMAISVNSVLMAHLGFRILFLVIYMVTCFKLFRTLRHYPDSIMEKEIKSIQRQSISFLIGFTLQAVYMILIILADEWTFALEVSRTAIMIISFVAPIWWLIFAHQQTFKGIDQDALAEKSNSILDSYLTPSVSLTSQTESNYEKAQQIRNQWRFIDYQKSGSISD